MFAKTILAGFVGTTMLATAAVAQTTTPADNSNSTMSKSPASSTASNMTHAGQWRSSKMIGLDVYNSNNEKLGDISELLIDSSGKIQAAVIGVGGFLGVGQRDVAVNFDQLKFVDQPVSSNTAMSGSSGTSTSTSASGTSSGTTTGAATSSSSNSTADRWYPDHAMYNASKDQLKSMPEFSYNSASSK
jgi:sporulation protein YlmC with PRC-barrel domain